jgi:hypothetical protein
MAHPYHSAVLCARYRSKGASGYPDRPTISRGPRVSIDEQHVALPKLYGAPAYARPSLPVAVSPKPFDPDDLPITAFQTDDERHLVSTLPARAYAPGGGAYIGVNGRLERGRDDSGSLRARPLSLRAIAGRLLGGD